MTQTSDALARLRESADYCRHRDIDTIQVKKADLLPVVALIDEMAEAMRTLIYYENWMDGYGDDVFTGTYKRVTCGEIRRAASVLAKLTPTTEEKA